MKLPLEQSAIPCYAPSMIVTLSLFLLSAFPISAFPALVTAYCPCAQCCGRANRPAANGQPPRAGLTIAGPRSIPLGTRVHIEGIGIRTVTDRLARSCDNRFDLFLPTHAAAKAWGLQDRRVTILSTPLPDTRPAPRTTPHVSRFTFHPSHVH